MLKVFPRRPSSPPTLVYSALKALARDCTPSHAARQTACTSRWDNVHLNLTQTSKVKTRVNEPLHTRTETTAFSESLLLGILCTTEFNLHLFAQLEFPHNNLLPRPAVDEESSISSCVRKLMTAVDIQIAPRAFICFLITLSENVGRFHQRKLHAGFERACSVSRGPNHQKLQHSNAGANPHGNRA
jgi:hypothetical protein